MPAGERFGYCGIVTRSRPGGQSNLTERFFCLTAIPERADKRAGAQRRPTIPTRLKLLIIECNTQRARARNAQEKMHFVTKNFTVSQHIHSESGLS
jgi:hypothetical protein